MFLQQVINSLTLGGVYALVAVGYTLVYGVLGLINFSHGSIYTWGAFFAFTLMAYCGFSFGLTFVLAMVLTSLLGLIIERLGYYPVRKSPVVSQIVSVVAVSIILDNLAMIIWGSSSLPFPAVNLPDVMSFGDIRISLLQCLIIGLAVSLMVFLYGLVYKTKAGTSMRATSLDADAARLMGINVERIRLLTFALSAALAAAAGSLIGVYYHSVVFNMGYGVVLKAFVVAILGGMGNVVGAMLGGMLMGIIECFGSAYISSGWKDAFVYVVLILVLMFKPNGLLGTYEQEKV
jgi:branched-chain amino acid transport system permease protein